MLEEDSGPGSSRERQTIMYVKIFSQILDSSLADDRRLRHFFMDLLLLSDPDGNVIMTPNAIATRIRADVKEVEWGLVELQKPDPGSLSKEHDGRRLVPLDGHGYGWRIVNYHIYRDYKTAKEMREASAARVRKWREKNAKKVKRGVPGTREKAYEKAYGDGDREECDRLSAPVDRQTEGYVNVLRPQPVQENPTVKGTCVIPETSPSENGSIPEVSSAPVEPEGEGALCEVCGSCKPESGTVCNNCKGNQ